MPNPRRRHSKARGRKRRTHWKLTAPNLSDCPQCKTPKMAHRVCPSCGYYDGKLVLDLEAKKAKKEAKKKKGQG
ncbi:MAG TPA: 50S ribosomal protein L32 [Candidatus Omnitrophica bacterium]|nr:50S ribosomal protein L32 [Candidatus Omnitrophota bacterium]